MTPTTARAILAALDEMAALYQRGDGMTDRAKALRAQLAGLGVREHDREHVAIKRAQARAAFA